MYTLMLFSDPLYSLLRILSMVKVQTGFSWPAIVVTTLNDSTSHFIMLWSADPLYMYLSLRYGGRGETLMKDDLKRERGNSLEGTESQYESIVTWQCLNTLEPNTCIPDLK